MYVIYKDVISLSTIWTTSVMYATICLVCSNNFFMARSPYLNNSLSPPSATAQGLPEVHWLLKCLYMLSIACQPTKSISDIWKSLHKYT